MTDAAHILNRARTLGLRIATAESCTGGMVSAALTAVPGSSDVFECGYATYSNAAKQHMLGVNPKTLDAVGAVSEQVAVEMAEGAGTRAGVDLAVSITGIAGPGGSDHKPEGRVCFALFRKGHATRSETVEFGPLGRDAVRQAAMTHALGLLAGALARIARPKP